MCSETVTAALSALCDAQPAWSATTKVERANVAREILTELAKDEWSTAGDWVTKEMELLRVNQPGIGAASRLAFGTFIKDFCEEGLGQQKIGAKTVFQSVTMISLKVTLQKI